MSAPTRTGVRLHARFAHDLPELAVPWQAERFPDARILVRNDPLARELGIDPDFLRTEAGLGFLTGGALPEGAVPVAQAYAGHQFGGLSPRLGDGRALLLGEVTTPQGELRDIHLKGSGPTPFARAGDGFAAVGPMLREYVISEAMHALGIPTTRALAVVATRRTVQRDEPLPGAVLTRVARSHLRVGSFTYARLSDDPQLVGRLTDVAIRRHHPAAADAENPALALLQAVTAAQAELIARWVLVGFVHGVMNTDNMTISGETIDYGPCAFLDVFDPSTSFSSIDRGGRYAFGNQPGIGQWNLARLAEALLPLIDADSTKAIEAAQHVLTAEYTERYQATWREGMRAKLGLPASVDAATVSAVASGFLELLEAQQADYTSSFRALAAVARGEFRPPTVVDSLALAPWVARWRDLAPDAALIERTNPVYIPRNALVEEALTAAEAGDIAPLHGLLDAVTDPYVARSGLERYADAPAGGGAYTTFCGT